MKRTSRSSGFALMIDSPGDCKHIIPLCNGDEGVQIHALEVLRGDVGEVALDQLDAGQVSIM